MDMPHATVAHMPHMHSETWTGASASSVTVQHSVQYDAYSANVAMVMYHMRVSGRGGLAQLGLRYLALP